MRNLLYILFYFAGCILLVHNVIPHYHHNELKEEQHDQEHKEADNLLDWLFLSFHDDLGEGHLEYFSESEELDIDSPILIQPFLAVIPQQHSLVQYSTFIYPPDSFTISYIKSSKKLISSFYQSSFLLRGPPCQF